MEIGEGERKGRGRRGREEGWRQERERGRVEVGEGERKGRGRGRRGREEGWR